MSICRVCENQENNDELITKSYYWGPRLNNFKYYLCGSCGSLSIDKIPEDTNSYYENYYSLQIYWEKEKILRKILKKLCLKFPENSFGKIADYFLNLQSDLPIKALSYCKPSKHSKILDVGCGTGQLIYELYNMGFKNALGIDPYLKKDIEHVNGSKVYRKDFFEENGKWNIIIFNHVYEHTETPLKILEKATQLLEPDGSIIIRIPNVDSYAFRKYRAHWFGIHAPVHYFLPSINGMKLLVNQAGLQIKKIRGENLLQFWAFSEAYRLGIWDYHPLGIRTFLENNKLKEFGKKPALFCKKDISYWKSLNKQILSYPELCDWSVYYIGIK